MCPGSTWFQSTSWRWRSTLTRSCILWQWTQSSSWRQSKAKMSEMPTLRRNLPESLKRITSSMLCTELFLKSKNTLKASLLSLQASEDLSWNLKEKKVSLLASGKKRIKPEFTSWFVKLDIYSIILLFVLKKRACIRIRTGDLLLTRQVLYH